MPSFLEDKINITYKRDDFISYMIIKLKDKNSIIEYQTEMMINNKIPGILQINVGHTNNETYLYYDITSKVTLSQYLKREKVTKEMITAMLTQVTETMIGSTNFLLQDGCFNLHEDYIYINPATNEIYLLYLPLSNKDKFHISLKDFVVNLIIYSVNMVEEDTSANYIQKILNYVKCEAFNIQDFNKLLMELYEYDGGREHGENKEYDNIKEKGCKKGPVSEKEGITKRKPKRFFAFMAMGLLQMIILLSLLLSKDYLKSLKGSSKTTYFALGVIILSIEAIVTKNLFETKKEAKPLNEREIESKPGLDNHGVFGGTRSEKSEPASYHKYNTVLLMDSAGLKEKLPYLKCLEEGLIQDVLINHPDFLIGRLKGYVDYPIPNDAVGKVHAQILVCQDKYYLKDLNSRNGTFLNDIQIESNVEHEIKAGDKIAFANSRHEFKLY